MNVLLDSELCLSLHKYQLCSVISLSDLAETGYEIWMEVLKSLNFDEFSFQ